MMEKIEGRRRRGQQRKRWLDGITDSMDQCFACSKLALREPNILRENYNQTDIYHVKFMAPNHSEH